MKDNKVVVYLEDDTLAWLEEVSRREGMKLSTLIRVRLRREMTAGALQPDRVEDEESLALQGVGAG